MALLASRRHHWLLGWICLTTSVDVFNVRTVINISAPTIAGLLLLYYTLPLMPSAMRTRPVRLMFIQYCYLVLLGLFFGFLIPWANIVGRPWNLQVEGRTVLYLLRQLAGLSLALFVAQQIVRTKNPRKFLRYIVAGTLFAAAAGVVSFLLGPGRSLYNLISLGNFSPSPEKFGTRAAGLNFEPRSLGLVVATGTLLCLLFLSRRRTWKWVAALGLSLGCLFLTRSTSSLIATGLGIIALFGFDRKFRRLLFPWVVTAGLVVALILVFGVRIPTGSENVVRTDSSWLDLMSSRIGTTVRFGEASNFFEQVVFRMEIFDAPSVLFLAANPLHLLIGTGPGLVNFPARVFLPVTPFTAGWVDEGLDSPPSMGFVLELANAGVIGLVLWLASSWFSLRALRNASAASEEHVEIWQIGVSMFLAMAMVYLIASGFLSSFWPLFMGMGFGAARLQLCPDRGSQMKSAAVAARK